MSEPPNEPSNSSDEDVTSAELSRKGQTWLKFTRVEETVRMFAVAKNHWVQLGIMLMRAWTSYVMWSSLVAIVRVLGGVA